MNKYFVYILECSDKSFYIGVTNNLMERFLQHQEGVDKECYTYSRRPLLLVYQEESDSIHDVIAREKQLKGWSRKKKQALINVDFEQLKSFAKAHGGNDGSSI